MRIANRKCRFRQISINKQKTTNQTHSIQNSKKNCERNLQTVILKTNSVFTSSQKIVVFREKQRKAKDQLHWPIAKDIETFQSVTKPTQTKGISKRKLLEKGSQPPNASGDLCKSIVVSVLNRLIAHSTEPVE